MTQVWGWGWGWGWGGGRSEASIGRRHNASGWRMSSCALAMICCVTSLFAQTRFEWPDSRVDIAKHPFLETCLAVVSRVSDSVYARSDVLFDTLPTSENGPSTPPRPDVVAAAQRCSVRFAAGTIPVAMADLAQEVYLLAGRDTDAATIVERRLAAIGASDLRERARVIDTVVRIYLRARPARLTAAQVLLDEINRDTVLPFERRLALNFDMARVTYALKSHVLFRHYAEFALALIASLPQDVRMSREGLGARVVALSLTRLLYRPELLDSLRRSTPAYAAVLRAHFERATGLHRDSASMTEGSRVPRVDADFWFPADAGQTPYPRPGHPAIIVFVNSYRPRLEDRQDLLQHVFLRRLQAKYPGLDVVLVAKTYGFFGPVEPPSPAKEAEWLNQLFREFQGTAGVLAVNTSPFMRLPEPDRRRITEHSTNEINFPGTPSPGTLYLVDQEGLVVLSGFLTGTEGLEEMLDILLRRER